MERVNSNIPDGYTKRAKRLADRENRSLANWIANLIIHAVDAAEAKSEQGEQKL